jgi:hypothetical protein
MQEPAGSRATYFDKRCCAPRMTGSDMMATKGHSTNEPRKGFFTRWFESMAEARMRHVEHELGRGLHFDERDQPEEEDGEKRKQQRPH